MATDVFERMLFWDPRLAYLGVWRLGRQKTLLRSDGPLGDLAMIQSRGVYFCRFFAATYSDVSDAPMSRIGAHGRI